MTWKVSVLCRFSGERQKLWEIFLFSGWHVKEESVKKSGRMWEIYHCANFFYDLGRKVFTWPHISVGFPKVRYFK